MSTRVVLRVGTFLAALAVVGLNVWALTSREHVAQEWARLAVSIFAVLLFINWWRAERHR